MKILNGQIRLAATDLSNYLACRHLTNLDLQVARGERTEPAWAAPDLATLRELGLRHEAAYLKFLSEQQKLAVSNLAEHKSEAELVAETLRLMQQGAAVIAQGALRYEQWFGRPDVLLRVPTPSKNWKWSYEVVDTKLTKQTKATTILQLALYSELLGIAQGSDPEFMWVITPNALFAGEKYRISDYSAYFRYVKRELLNATRQHTSNGTYP